MRDPIARAMTDPDTRVVVIGAGVAGLVTARECARPGFSVTVLEASDRVGGTVSGVELAGLRIDTGAESFATRGGGVAALIDELGLTEEIVSPNPAGAWLQLSDRAVPMPTASLLGIPSSPLSKDVIAALGWRGALRAYLDRLMPVMKIGHERNLGRLVRRRMGNAVLTKLVAPIMTGVYSTLPDDAEVASAAPGLNLALTRLGTLSGAVAELRGGSTPGSAVAGLNGGMARLVDALAADAVARDVVIRLGEPVDTIQRVAAGPDREEVETEEGSAEGDISEEQCAPWAVTLADRSIVGADVVVIATSAGPALDLLRGASAETAELADLDWPQLSVVETASLVLGAPELDSAPRGTGVLAAKNAPVRAKALTHASAKWEWIRRAAGEGTHVVRVSYGRPGDKETTTELNDDEFYGLALRDASTLLGVRIDHAQVLGFVRTQWEMAIPRIVTGQRHRLAQVREYTEKVDGLEIAGSWVAGTGLASVVPDAKEVAKRVRRQRWKRVTGEDAQDGPA